MTSEEHPAHYNKGKIEVWDFIADQRLGFLEGNIIKYVCRYRFKGAPLKDLQKAKAYLERLIMEHTSLVSWEPKADGIPDSLRMEK